MGDALMKCREEHFERRQGVHADGDSCGFRVFVWHME